MFVFITVFEQMTLASSFRITNPKHNSFLWLLKAASKFIFNLDPISATHLSTHTFLSEGHSRNRCSLISAPD
ncbi:hypothetical protein E1A91_A11G163800v1 [Gossypium mustelinum]|uniref:Uncharacterized protein n=3 Tax=Gossypium TaxID=3633 RepID=A0A5J5TN89_GOSBA|nr:hypothetical protein ES319_A11G160700v1 [Gossypium barbadense]TYG94226.1 hypothetical protein ES288_A11G170900v1 [Gossypium darwinii]TYJ09795.1 hypothetical protein E1A91_A11G163800v1 [Gossypium mustelinum]KAB2057330.1 hypothetical protein ES319_A11G160700v1 [Gossypium barbadense]TYG94227.1 hypothetical protein ES288_A11G170900v1 [Gossypium darwinii]